MFLLLALACSDYKVTPDEERASAGDYPDIEVVPDALLFDPLAPGELVEQRFTVTNRGEAPLVLDPLLIAGSGAFQADLPSSQTVLDFEESIEVSVRFSPENAEDIGSIYVNSNDEGNPSVIVPLEGTGLYPEVRLTPDPYDFGGVPEGCTATSLFQVSNVGLSPLTVESAVAVGAGFDATALVELPAVLAPGESMDLSGSFAPPGEASAQVWVTSDDPRGVLGGAWAGRVIDIADITDQFEQGQEEFDSIDLIIYVDQSGSMSDDQENLGRNANAMWEALSSNDADWQLIVSNNDDGCHIGDVYSQESGSQSSFAAAVKTGGGDWTEAGLTIGLNTLEKTLSGCNAGFLREDSRTVLVLVSDEVEQSPRPWAEMVAQIQAISEDAVIFGVAGNLPDGCGSAEPGYGYAEAAAATGGELLSICSADWGAYFSTIATVSASDMRRQFVLSSTPDPATIEVVVNGEPSDEWYYDAHVNAVSFYSNTLPPPHATIDVTYRLAADCEQ
jgi:hypothetical protein